MTGKTVLTILVIFSICRTQLLFYNIINTSEEVVHFRIPWCPYLASCPCLEVWEGSELLDCNCQELDVDPFYETYVIVLKPGECSYAQIPLFELYSNLKRNVVYSVSVDRSAGSPGINVFLQPTLTVALEPHCKPLSP